MSSLWFTCPLRSSSSSRALMSFQKRKPVIAVLALGVGLLLALVAGEVALRLFPSLLPAQVRLRLDGALYELHARRVTHPREVEAFGEAWTGQSFFRRDPRKYDEVWIYELTPRSRTPS